MKQMADLLNGTPSKVDFNFMFGDLGTWWVVVGLVLDDPWWLELCPRVQIWVSRVGFSWMPNPMVALAKLYLDTMVGSMSFCTYVRLWDQVIWYIKRKGLKSWFRKWHQTTWLTQFWTLNQGMNSGFLHNLDSGLHFKQLLVMTKFCRRDIHGVGQHHGEVRVLLHLRAVVGSGYVIHQMKGLEMLI